MAIYQTDETQQKQNQQRKKVLDKIFTILMVFALLHTAVDIVPLGIFVFLDGIFRGALQTIICFFSDAILSFLVLRSVYRKDPRFTGISILITFGLMFGCLYIFPHLCNMYGIVAGTYSLRDSFEYAVRCLVILVITLILSSFWIWLTKQPGFPLFRESYEELKTREQDREMVAYQRAIQSGARPAEMGKSTGDSVEMDDVLDVRQPVHYVNPPRKRQEAYDNRAEHSVTEVAERYAPHLPQSGNSAPSAYGQQGSADQAELLPFQKFDKGTDRPPSDEMEDLTKAFPEEKPKIGR